MLYLLVKRALSLTRLYRFKGAGFADVDDHRKVYDAIVAGDADQAKKAMEYIINEALTLIRAAKQDATNHSESNLESP